MRVGRVFSERMQNVRIKRNVQMQDEEGEGANILIST